MVNNVAVIQHAAGEDDRHDLAAVSRSRMRVSKPAAEVPPEPGAGTSPHAPAGRWVTFILSLSLGIAFLSLLLFVLSPLAPPPPDLKEVQRLIATDAVLNNAGALRPEPLERFLYTTGVLLLPFCLFASYLLVRRCCSSARAGLALQRLEPAAVWFATGAAVALLVSAGLAESGPDLSAFLPGGWYSLVVALVLALLAAVAASQRSAERAGLLPWILSSAAVGVLLLGTIAVAVFREEHIRNLPVFWASFNAVFYSVVQVFLGRELTVDFINQYGLYPHLLEPLFSLVGLSVFSFTLTMGLLNCLSFACLHLVLARETRSPLIGALGTTSVFFFCYAFGKAVAQPDLYFQYHPLRILFPSILLATAQAFSHRPRRWMPAALGALGAASFLWATDVGIVVLASGCLYLGYDSLARRHPREIPSRLAQAATAAGAVLLLFSLYLRLKFGSLPDYAQLFSYPRAFYLYGNFMLPMPRYGLWVPVLAVYALGLLRALVPLVEGEAQPRHRLFFLLSVLGLGLFAYYQGRSVLAGLAFAAYPAVLLVAVFADDLRRASPGDGRSRGTLLVTLLTLLFFSVPAVAVIAPPWIRGIAEKIRVVRHRESTDVLRDVSFLQGRLRPGEQVVIISYNSGLLHLVTRTTNPLDIPGDSELLYRADFDKQTDYVFGRRGKAVVDRTTMSQQFVTRVRNLYRNRVENPFGNLIVLNVP